MGRPIKLTRPVEELEIRLKTVFQGGLHSFVRRAVDFPCLTKACGPSGLEARIDAVFKKLGLKNAKIQS